MRTAPQNPPDLRGHLLWTRDPRRPPWPLHPMHHQAPLSALLSWRLEPAPTDAGVPIPVARLLVETLAATFRVTFLNPAVERLLERRERDWMVVDAGLGRLLEPGRLASLIRRPALPLLCSREPARLMALFEAGPFSWELQSQLLILSAPDAPPPPLEYADVFALLHRQPPAAPFFAAHPSVQACAFPGVDGDFLELYFLEARLRDELATAFAVRCPRHGLGWSELSEEALYAALRR